MAVDPVFVKDDYKHIFEKVLLKESNMPVDPDAIDELEHAAVAIQKRLAVKGDYIRQPILHDLLFYFVGIIAEIYQKGAPIPIHTSTTLITFKFKALLGANYQTMKRPAEYAFQLNITPAYLNEAVKKTTGLTVSDWIQYEIILQAKRLLYHTSMSVKEVAHELGYEDYAYFNRLFTKVAHMSPGQFRKKYFK
ncbi:MAG: helix-turn-helix domain-containing protein [Tannerellaceae bacterium]|nr:helix-turn-helix domain-containing protein [Tannerellaceae bacterium]